MKKLLIFLLVIGFTSCMPVVHMQQRYKERNPNRRLIVEVSPYYFQPLYLYPLILPRVSGVYQPYSRPFRKLRIR